MADLKRYVIEESNMDLKAGRPDITQESLKTQTSSLKNNASSPPAQLSADGREKAASGAQPTPFVHSGVPAVARPDSVSPAGPPVNGPASHPASDEPGAPNKGPRAAESTMKPPSPQAPDPPGELRPDARRNRVGPEPETPPPAADAARPGGDGSGSRAAGGRSPPVKNGSELPTGRVGAGVGAVGGAWGFETESSESSSDDCDPGWGSQTEFVRRLWNERHKEEEEKQPKTAPLSLSQRQRKSNAGMADASKSSQSNGCSEYECPLANNRAPTFKTKPSSQSAVDSCETAVAIKQLSVRSSTKNLSDGIGVCKADGFSWAGGRFKQRKDESSAGLGPGPERETSFFPCTKCNVNFKEERHLHRHMMYHLDRHNEAHRMDVAAPCICRECGRSFRDRGSLLKHAVVHQERRRKLVEEMKGLGELRDEGPAAGLQCLRRVFGTSCPETFARHARTHERDGRHLPREERDRSAAAESESEAPRYAAQHVARAPGYATVAGSVRLTGRGTFVTKKNGPSVPASFSCETRPFGAQSGNALGKHAELAHRQFASDFGSPPYNETNDYKAPAFQLQFPRKLQKADSQRLQLKPKFCIQRQAFRKRAELPFWSDLFIKSTSAQKAHKGFGSSLSRWSLGNSANKLSPFPRRSDKPSKLSLHHAEKIDVTTGLPYDEDRKVDQEFGNGFSGNAEMPKSILSCYEPLVPKMEPASTHYVGYDSDSVRGDTEEPDSSRLTTPPVTKKPPSKRKMSIPYHNTTDKTTHVILSKHEHAAKRHISAGRYEDAYDFSDYTSEATANFLHCSENEQNPYARSYFIRRQRGPVKPGRGPSANVFQRDRAEKGRHEIRQFAVKEELVEVPLGTGAGGAGHRRVDSPLDFGAAAFGAERRSCPYCPAAFESGVGLSNHVRGHLHRVGLSYDARHVVTPEQVASRDRRLRVRKKAPPALRRIKKDRPELQTEHTCPLCGGWFDTKTGLSNHVRGHLKRIGKTISSTSKSPVCILNEMMKDEEEYRNILRALDRKRFHSRPFLSQKFAGCSNGSDGLFLTPTEIPVKIRHAGQGGEPWGPSVPRPGGGAGQEEARAEPERGARGPSSGSLVELLEQKKLGVELELKDCSQSARKLFTMPLPNESGSGTRLVDWPQEKSEITKRVCLHCDVAFPSAVSLSNHLRAYARRKRAALLEGTSYECKQKKPRSRPGPKKKPCALTHAGDEVYRLTCRFCDLVFQGPLSVQEDWIKHLQRHIMNASVPRTGAGMVEVTATPAEPVSVAPEEPTPPALSRATPPAKECTLVY